MSKRNAAMVVAGLMMAHFDGPFDDNAFYYDLIEGEGTDDEQEGAEYFDDNKHDLRTDREFHVLVADSVREFLMESLRQEEESASDEEEPWDDEDD